MRDLPPLSAVAPPSTGVYRIARIGVEPFDPPDWRYVHDDGTFGQRFDDPRGAEGRPIAARFRIIYCATQREAALAETLAGLRTSLPVLARLAEVEDDEPVVGALAGAIEAETPHRGLIPADWRLRRQIGRTVLDPESRFVDLGAAGTIQHLRRALAPLAAELALNDVDLSSMSGSQRRFTQSCAAHVHEVREDGGPPFAGIRYPSRFGEGWECWAVFADRLRHAPGWPAWPEPILADDPDLARVAALFNLSIETTSFRQTGRS